MGRPQDAGEAGGDDTARHGKEEREVERQDVGQRADDGGPGEHAEVTESGDAGDVDAGGAMVGMAGGAEEFPTRVGLLPTKAFTRLPG